ncbi:protein disulfide isomerase [Pleurotus eryngii]|uniref:protein disulfide-isomerase n=1 Tax=Pleurotus eryngii TaxID=5323 RepID=A0A9P6D1A4_PLEER|nr:protein disulfide isomerase [Pleurotus eryngii]
MHLRSLLSPCAALVLLSLAAASSASDVIRLTALSFESIVPTEPLILVRFCTQRSGHCKALIPHYEQAAALLKANNIKIANVDCSEEADFCEAHEVQDYPTLKVFRHGSWVSDYTGPHHADGIISYMLEQSLPAVSEVTAENHQQFQEQAGDSTKVVVIAYLTSPTEAPADTFIALAENHRDHNYVFGLTTDNDSIDAAGVTPPAIVAYRSFDDPMTEYPLPVSDATAAELEEWISDLSMPLIDEISAENYATYTNSPKPLAYLFLDPSDERKDAHIESMRPIAQKYKSEINFAWMDAVGFGDHAGALDFEDVECREVTSESAEDWLQQLLKGELPEPKSAPIPEAQDELVFTLVAKQFDEIVFDDSRDVFLELYTTQCEECERMKPAWDALAEEYAPLKDRVTIAKMDMQENDLPASAPFGVTGFPTIVFKPAGTRTFIDYDEDRTLEDFIVFVEVNTGNSVDIPEVEPVVSEGMEVAQVPLGAET